MRKLSLYLFLILVLSGSSFSQQFISDGEIGAFKSASAFSLSSMGYFYVSDASENKIYKIDTLGSVAKEIGGYGWSSSAFDTPSDVSTNSLNVYVADQYNRRIQAFDKDLNFLYEIKGETSGGSKRSSISFGYPTSCAVSPLGSIYILDSENKKALKFNSNGDFAVEFGGFDYGRFALSEPASIRAVSGDVSIIADGTKLLFFDSFGSGIAQLDMKEKITGINAFYDYVTANSESKVYLINVKDMSVKELQLMRGNSEEKIIRSVYNGTSLYILYENEIVKLKKG